MSHASTDSQFHTFREILSQPQAWRATLQEIQHKAAAARDLWRSHERPEVIFTGCGSPYYLARSAAATFQGLLGVPAQVHPASDIMLFPDLTLPAKRPRLLIAISRSGTTTELLKAIEVAAGRDHNPTIGITCYDDTALVQAASLTLVARAAQEQSLAQTRSFTSMLLAAQGVIGALADHTPSDAWLRLPDDCAALLEQHRALAEQLGRDASFERFFFLGSGPLYGLACEAMLKMKEMSLSYSEAYHFLEFRHGPMSMVNRKTLIVGLLTKRGLAHELAVLSEMQALGARVLAITPVELAAGLVDYQVVLPPELADLERGALYLPILQLMTFYRALHNGLNPDLPANLNAVVHLDIDAIEQRSPQATREPVG